MNVITQLNIASKILDSVSLKHSVYFFLLATALQDKEREEVECKYSLRELPDQLPFFEESVIKESLVELANDGLIKLDKRDYRIVLGIIRDTKIHLFGTGEDDTLKKYHKLLSKTSTRFSEKATGFGMILARDTHKKLHALLEKPLTEWMVSDFVRLYKYSYVSLFQQPAREWDKKEIGQMKTLFVNYQGNYLFKIIVHYIFNSEKYSKKAVSLGMLMFHKDTIYMDVAEKTAETVKMDKLRTRSDDDEKDRF